MSTDDHRRPRPPTAGGDDDAPPRHLWAVPGSGQDWSLKDRVAQLESRLSASDAMLAETRSRLDSLREQVHAPHHPASLDAPDRDPRPPQKAPPAAHWTGLRNHRALVAIATMLAGLAYLVAGWLGRALGLGA